MRQCSDLVGADIFGTRRRDIYARPSTYIIRLLSWRTSIPDRSIVLRTVSLGHATAAVLMRKKKVPIIYTTTANKNRAYSFEDWYPRIVPIKERTTPQVVDYYVLGTLNTSCEKRVYTRPWWDPPQVKRGCDKYLC